MIRIPNCNDAFELKEIGTILSVYLYLKKGVVKHGDKFTATVVKHGKEINKVDGTYGVIFSGKKHRYDMDLFSIILSDLNIKD